MRSAPDVKMMSTPPMSVSIACTGCGEPVLQLAANEGVYPAGSSALSSPGVSTRHARGTCTCGRSFDVPVTVMP